MTLRFAFSATAVLAALLALGCKSSSRVELTSYSDPYFPEKYHFQPNTCSYRNDAGGDYHVVAYSSGDAVPGEAATEQWLHIHMFWQPRPGKTRDNPTSMDATVRYVVKTPKGTTLYTGTAFVYPAESKPGSGLKVSVESGRLHVATQTGDAPEMLGETRLNGLLQAKRDPNAALDLQRQMDVAAGTGEE